MITNSVSVNARTSKNGFKFLTAVITVLFVFSVTVTTFAATSGYKVTVTDGEKSVSISAKTNNPRELVKQAGFVLDANDHLDLSDFSAGKGGEIVVKRDGIMSRFTNRISGINKEGIKLSENDTEGHSKGKSLIDLSEIRIFRVKYDTKAETQPVKYDTEIIYSDKMFVDEKLVVTKGVDGEKRVIFTAKYVVGELEEKYFERERVIKDPVNEVIKVGTKKRATLASHKDSKAPISDLKVPADLKLDKNGIPVDYAYCVNGKATAYTGDPETASGRKPMPGHIAVDPKEYPYGTELYVVSADGRYVYGYCIAADTGGFVKMGNTDIDLYMDNEDMCDDWGNRGDKIYVLN